MKKLLLLSAFFMCAFSAFAEVGDTIVVSDIYYMVYTENDKNKFVEVIGNQNPEKPYSGDIVLPDTVTNNGIDYAVARIANRAFNACEGLTTIKLPNTLLEIGHSAFQNCSNLSGELKFPDKLTTIYDYAFQNCVGITAIEFPESLTRINGYAFSGCTGLTTLLIPANVKNWGGWVFEKCTGLIDVTLDETYAQKIHDYMFDGCSALESISMSEGVTMIGNYSFRNCANLTSIYIGSSATRIQGGAFTSCTKLEKVEIKGSITEINGSAFAYCESLSSINFPESLTRIDGYAFRATNLTGALVLPDNITYIGDYAFRECPGLTSVKLPKSLQAINTGVFYLCKNLTGHIVIPDSVKSIGVNAFNTCPLSGDLVIPDAVTSIGSNAFNRCTGLTSLTIGNGMITIGPTAFYGCTSLTSITLGENLEKIEKEAFYNCVNLAGDLVIPDKVVSIGNNAFTNDSNLLSLTLGNSLNEIGSSAFAYCRKLEGNLVIPNSVTKINNDAFRSCAKLTSLTLGNNLSTIGNLAFYQCSGLTGELIIPNSVTNIGTSVFQSCPNLTSVVLGNGVTTVGQNAFASCAGLTAPIYNDHLFAYMPYNYRPEGPTAVYEYVIPYGITTIANYAFDGTYYLKSVVIPETVTRIENYAFRSCSRLVSAPIPESVTFIGEGIFNNCSALNKPMVAGDVLVFMPNGYIKTNHTDSIYTLPDSIHRIGGYAFQNCKNMKQIIIHDGLTDIGANAFSGCTNLKDPVYSQSVFAYMPVSYAGEYQIPEGIKRIASYAFANCTGLTAITIPESIDTIAPYAFNSCSNLKSVQWNAKQCKDFNGDGAAPFRSKRDSVYSIVFGEAVEHIPAYLCYDFNNITSIVIPDKVKTIGKYAFHHCEKLASVSIGENVTTMGYRAITYNYNLTSIVWNAKHCEDFLSNDYRPFYESLEKVTSFTFGENVEYIPNHLCREMQQITSIIIPKNVKTIGENAFYNCTGLTSVAWNARECAYFKVANPFPSCSSIASMTFGEEVEYIPARLCDSQKNLKLVSIPNDVSYIGEYAFTNCHNLTAVNIPNRIKKIEKGTFYNCHSLTSLVIPEGVDTIFTDAFVNCIGLTSVVIPESMDSIMPSAWNGCTGLRTVTWKIRKYADCTSSNLTPFANVRGNITTFIFGENVEHIPNYLCNYMDKLTTITIPKTLNSIGTNAFYNCASLKEVHFLGTIEDWCSMPFASNTANPLYYGKNLFIDGVKVSDVVIPESITSINPWTFYNCNSLTSVVVNNKVTTIGAEAFRNCISLQSVTIGELVDSITTNAFSGCTALTNVVWKPRRYDNFKGISSTPFYGARSQITSFTFGDKVEHIPAYMCNNMSKLISITIPQSVESVGLSAFTSCSGLKKTNYLGSVENWCGISFANYVSNPIVYSKNFFINGEQVTNLVIPASVKEIKSYAFYGCSTLKNVALLHETLPLPTLGTEPFYNTYNALLDVRCPLREEAATVTPWKSFKKKEYFYLFIDARVNRSAYGTVETKQVICDSEERWGTMNAVPNDNHRFVGWSDGETINPRTIEVTQDTAFTAIFASEEEFTIEVTSDSYLSELTWGPEKRTNLSICDIVVKDGATLTCDVDNQLINITVDKGSTLYVDNGVHVAINTLTAQSEDDVQPQIITDGTGAIDYKNFQVAKQIPADRYYFFSLPFDCNTNEVLIDGVAAVYNTDWNYLYYDGAGFAQNPSNESYWLVDETGTIQAGKGYAVGVDAPTPETYRELIFRPSTTPDFARAETKVVPAYANAGSPNGNAAYKGWNFIVNPYTSNFSGALAIPGIVDNNPYVSVPIAGQNQVYHQCRLSEIGNLPPFSGFFVQVADEGDVTFTPGASVPANPISEDAQAEENALLFIGLNLSNGAQDDETTLVIGETYTEAYEIGSDLRKMVGYGDKPQVYTYDATTQYAFKSMNQESATEKQALGVYLPETATYTFSLAEPIARDTLQAVYLYDSATGQQMDLLQGDYEFTSGKLTTDTRFAISAVFKKPAIPTALPTTETLPTLCVWQDGAGNIILRGVSVGDKVRIVDASGRVVAQWVATATTTRGAVPVAGLYVVETTNVANVQVHKVVVQ